MRSVNSWNVAGLLVRTACCTLLMVSGLSRWILAAFAVLILAADDEIGFRISERLEGVGVLHLRFAGEHVEADALDARGGAGEVVVDERLIEADGFKDLRAAIALQRADAHLGEGLEQALVDGLDEVLLGLVRR